MPKAVEGLTKTQTQRVQNIGGRVAKKIQGTFGDTCETFEVIDAEDLVEYLPVDAEAGAAFEVVSRGVVYTFIISATKAAG